ncbi:Hypothetical predicted protein [Cloeon dipterum]|uniref:Sine oculis-binding protein homolog n=3 Tax=Cloeon dipterum TaxID=197152 RepID=A0A8S1BVY8_9INSE|nr:Hypothetical predicted protein [Cloeon dipterum]
MGSRNASNPAAAAAAATHTKCNSGTAPKNFRLPAALRVAALPGVRKEQQEDEIKKYAETAMNELLGWYGYEKVDSTETQGLQLRQFGPSASLIASQKRAKMQLEGGQRRHALSRHRQKAAAAAAATAPPPPPAPPDSTDSDDEIDPGRVETLSTQSKEQSQSDMTVCSWCHQLGAHIFDNTTGKDQRAFCSEQCFSQCRRATFKRNKVCDWCKHVRHSTNYIDFKDSESQLQFCSEKCLNQCKMSIFCKEAQAHLQSQLVSPDPLAPSSSGNGTLITPELWLKDCKNSDDDASGFAGSVSPKSSISSRSSNRSVSPTQLPPPPTASTSATCTTPSPKNSAMPVKHKLAEREKKYKETSAAPPPAPFPMGGVPPDPAVTFPLPPPPRFPEQFCFPSLRPPFPPFLRHPFGLGVGPFAGGGLSMRSPMPPVTVMLPCPIPLPIPIPIPIILPLFNLPSISPPPSPRPEVAVAAAAADPPTVANKEGIIEEEEDSPPEPCPPKKKKKQKSA